MGTWSTGAPYTAVDSDQVTDEVNADRVADIPIATQGAADGDVLAYDAGTGEFSPATLTVGPHATSHETGGTDVIRIDQLAAAGADVNLNSHKLTNVTDPVSAQDAATKNYVDLLTSTITENAISGTTYTLVLTDAAKTVTANNAAATVFTVPTNTNVAYPTGTVIFLLQNNTGQLQIVGDTGVTVTAAPGAFLRARFSMAMLYKRATNTWELSGDLAT